MLQLNFVDGASGSSSLYTLARATQDTLARTMWRQFAFLIAVRLSGRVMYAQPSAALPPPVPSIGAQLHRTVETLYMNLVDECKPELSPSFILALARKVELAVNRLQGSSFTLVSANFAPLLPAVMGLVRTVFASIPLSVETKQC